MFHIGEMSQNEMRARGKPRAFHTVCAALRSALLQTGSSRAQKLSVLVPLHILAASSGLNFSGDIWTHPEGAVVFQHACKMGLEGIVSKRLGSHYRSGVPQIG